MKPFKRRPAHKQLQAHTLIRYREPTIKAPDRRQPRERLQPRTQPQPRSVTACFFIYKFNSIKKHNLHN